ncbi:MAG: hypothetical protein L6R38_009378 [Xanthoria sp. 2 TBL-2021]|nr:MAG: hypothetical protein L6R38_009378 [Xanthoria sp. 2 TBL-2021]
MPRLTDREAIGRPLLTRLYAQRLSDTLDTLGDDSSSSSSSSASSSGDDTSSDEEAIENTAKSLCLLYTKRFLNPRQRIRRSSSSLDICLDEYRVNRPDLFRKQARMYPSAFNSLCSYLSDDFVNPWRGREQIPVEYQVLVALKRFGKYGNGPGMDEISQWSGFGAAYARGI